MQLTELFPTLGDIESSGLKKGKLASGAGEREL
jgi:hypothetical protein